jgi:hypothetical protein
MKRLVVVLTLVGSVGLVTVAAQRIITNSAEPYLKRLFPDPFSVEPPEFAAQFKGKSVRAPFRVGEDIHAVWRATISVTSGARAVRDSVRTMARLFLNPASVKE